MNLISFYPFLVYAFDYLLKSLSLISRCVWVSVCAFFVFSSQFFSSLVLYAGSVSPFVSIRFVPFAVFVCIHSHIHTGVLYRYICICIWKCGGGESRSIKAMTCFHIISIRLCAVRALLLFCLVLAEGGVGGEGARWSGAHAIGGIDGRSHVSQCCKLIVKIMMILAPNN